MGTDRSLRYTEHRLAPGTAPRTRYEYIVTGRGSFPLDMLRHDACWPMSSSDVAKLDAGAGREPRSIAIRSYSAPTIERWKSFGWSPGVEKLIPDTPSTGSARVVCRICGEEGHSWQRCGQD